MNYSQVTCPNSGICNCRMSGKKKPKKECVHTAKSQMHLKRERKRKRLEKSKHG